MSDGEPAANSPEDVGFSPPAPAPELPARHAPKFCSSCSAPILWAAALDEHGQRTPREERGGWKSIPVDYQPTADGNVQVFDRPGQGIVGKVYRDAAHAPPGAILRKAHFATCPHADQHRKGRRRR